MSLWEAFIDLIRYNEDNPMLFSSGQFLVFFTVFFIGYMFVRNRINLRLVYVILFSLFFYYKSSGWYVGLLGGCIVFNYLVGVLLVTLQPKAKKALLIFSILANLAPLFYFKYTDFFLFNWAMLSGGGFDALRIFLPIGISFFTFQTISYVVDIYKKDIEPCRNILDFAFYLSFFPQLVAGPIVRAKDFLPQLRRRVTLDTTPTYGDNVLDEIPPMEESEKEVKLRREHIGEGLFMILKGFVKKAIIGDYLGQYVSLIYGDPRCIAENTYVTDVICANPETYSGFENLMAMYAYTMQIYCDFSGYSDMAIGLALIMGFRLLDNFRNPYQSLNITEFWRKWHISLSFWLRDYVYIALGGNRKGEINRYLFLMITMLVGGWWHGASWKFVFWGAMHGAGLIVHKLWTTYIIKDKNAGGWIRKALGWLITFHFVAFLWVYFRAESFEVATISIVQMFSDFSWDYLQPFWFARPLLMTLMIGAFAIHFIKPIDKIRASQYFSSLPLLAKAFIFLLFIQIALQLQSADVQPFIYYQF